MMDALDKKILDIMCENARITMKELAAELKISAPAVAERVRRLEQHGIIAGYKAVVNREKLGQNITVFINMDIPASKYDEFKTFADKEVEISEFYYVTGQYSLVIKAFVQDTEHLANLLERIQSFGQTETFVVMYSNIKKDEFNVNL